MAIVAKMSDGKTVVIGLEDGNIERLKADMPFVHKLGQYDLPDIDIVLVYGKDKHDILRQLKPSIRAETQVKFSGKTRT